jgi:glucuronoarabinoxylan endo-1,4-beta-xylanase
MDLAAVTQGGAGGTGATLGWYVEPRWGCQGYFAPPRKSSVTLWASELLTWWKLRETKFPLFQVRSAECGMGPTLLRAELRRAGKVDDPPSRGASAGGQRGSDKVKFAPIEQPDAFGHTICSRYCCCLTEHTIRQTSYGVREADMARFIMSKLIPIFCAFTLLAAIPVPAATTTIDATKLYQTIEGLGGATAFYAGWVTAHPYKQEIYSNAFAGLNLSMLRLGDWFRYPATLTGFDSAATEIVANANRILGQPVPVYMSSWSPPAFLKSNGQVANGGTLIYTNGGFAYTDFAQYWYDSIQAYKSNGVNLTWISIQNEPDWAASYDSCIFHPTEDTVNGTNYASYSKALDAVYQRLANLPAPPKLLAPEPVHIAFNDLKNYAATMNSNSFYGVAHHLYGDGGGTGDSFLSSLSSAAGVFPGKPHFMTEYGDVNDMLECANLIHNCLAVEQVSGYNHWSLVWPGTNGGLIQIENPFASQSTWTNAPPGTPTQSHGWWYSPSYWSMKHFSYFIQPGYRRVSATGSATNVLTSAYLSPDGLRLVVVFINRNPSTSTNNLNSGSFPYFYSSVYQTAGTNYFQSLGSVGSQLALPAKSLTTVVLDKFVAVGSAVNPSPTNHEAGVSLSAVLSWTPGSNAMAHAVYLGTSSNSVVQATRAAPEFRGVLTNNSFIPALFGGTTYYWRVDEFAGVNTSTGSVWSFSTAAVPALAHRYSFSELGGLSVADSVGGPGWAGTLPGGGTFSSGQLTLASSAQQYVSLPAGILSTFSNCTIEVWVRLNSTANWSRVFDFGNSTTSYMFLTPQNGSTSRVRFAITTSGASGERQIEGTSALAAGVWYDVAVTLSGNTGVLYVNGVPVGTNNAMTLKPSSLGSTVNNYLGKSQYSDPYLNGLMDEFRIYSVALSAAELAATFALGPNQVLSTDSPALSFTTTPSNLTLAWPLANAGFTLQTRTNLIEGNWVNATSPTPQIVGGRWQVAVSLSGDLGSTFYRLAK